jgi:hypothetical protein
MLTKKKGAQNNLKGAKVAFEIIKCLLVERVINEQDQLVLYLDTSTKAIAGVLMQIEEDQNKH